MSINTTIFSQTEVTQLLTDRLNNMGRKVTGVTFNIVNNQITTVEVDWTETINSGGHGGGGKGGGGKNNSPPPPPASPPPPSPPA